MALPAAPVVIVLDATNPLLDQHERPAASSARVEAIAQIAREARAAGVSFTHGMNTCVSAVLNPQGRMCR